MTISKISWLDVGVNVKGLKNIGYITFYHFRVATIERSDISKTCLYTFLFVFFYFNFIFYFSLACHQTLLWKSLMEATALKIRWPAIRWNQPGTRKFLRPDRKRIPPSSSAASAPRRSPFSDCWTATWSATATPSVTSALSAERDSMTPLI